MAIFENRRETLREETPGVKTNRRRFRLEEKKDARYPLKTKD
jgi:hypothetical protein